MAKRSNKPRKSAPAKTHTKGRAFTEEDLDDEIDAFHKQRDVVPLDLNEDEANTDEEMEHAVFDLEGGQDDSDDSESADDEEEEDIRPRGFAAKIARQAKYLKQKFGGFDDEMDDDDDDDNEKEKEKKALWGRSKGSYYGGDNVDYEIQESDEELHMEEEEVVKLQKEKARSLRLKDLGLEDPDDSDSDGQEKVFQDTFVGKKILPAQYADVPTVDDIPFESFVNMNKELEPMSKEKQMEFVYSSAPELVGLLAELDKALHQLKQVKPLLSEVMKEKKDTTKGTMNYLEVKHTLLLTYCQAINFYLLLKSEGHSILGHPVVSRLVQIKNMLEKLEQIDPGLSSHVEDIVNAETDVGVKVARKSTPVNIEPELVDPSTKTHEITPVNKPSQLMEGDQSKDLVNKNVSKNLQDAPHVGLQSLEMLKVRANLEVKLKEKGIYNPSHSNAKRTQNHDPKLANQRLETLDDFDDEVQQTAKRRRDGNNYTGLLQLSKSSQLVATKGKKQKIISGDDDLPKRDDIGERRRKFELRVLAKTGTKCASGADNVEDAEEGYEEAMATDALEEDGEASEDEFYQQVKKQRANKLMAKAQLYSRTPSTQSQPLETVDGKRSITQKMETNKGLTPKRNKKKKNPRTNYKNKHRKAVTARKGQVRDIRKPSGPYGGESTGINKDVSRSRRLY